MARCAQLLRLLAEVRGTRLFLDDLQRALGLREISALMRRIIFADRHCLLLLIELQAARPGSATPIFDVQSSSRHD